MDEEKFRIKMFESRERQRRKKELERIKRERLIRQKREEEKKERLKAKKEYYQEREKRLKEEQKKIEEEINILRGEISIYHEKFIERMFKEDELYSKEELMNPPEGEEGRINWILWSELISRGTIF